MVPQTKVIETANAADIGIALPSIAFPQNRFALPNKLFEYLHAGLLVIFPAGTDMARVTALHDCCLTLSESEQTPDGIAAALNSIDYPDLAIVHPSTEPSRPTGKMMGVAVWV